MNIVKGDYTSFEESPSDHLWMYVDIEKEEIVGESMKSRARPIERKATLKIPSIREKFSLQLNKQVAIHDILGKVCTLYEGCMASM